MPCPIPSPLQGMCAYPCLIGLDGGRPTHFFLMCSERERHESLSCLTVGDYMWEGLRWATEYEMKLDQKTFLAVGWASNKPLAHSAPCSILFSSPCLERGLARWGQTGESQLWEQTQEMKHRPPALCTCTAHPDFQQEGPVSGGPSECSAPTSPVFSCFSDGLVSAWVKEISLYLLQNGSANKGSRSYISMLAFYTPIYINRLKENVHTLHLLYFCSVYILGTQAHI